MTPEDFGTTIEAVVGQFGAFEGLPKSKNGGYSVESTDRSVVDTASTYNMGDQVAPGWRATSEGEAVVTIYDGASPISGNKTREIGRFTVVVLRAP